MLNSQAITPRSQTHRDAARRVPTRTESKSGVTRAEILDLFQRDFAAMNRRVANDVRV